MNFFKLSEMFKDLSSLASSLSSYHLYRYYFFVKNSELGLECRYAKKTKALYSEEGEGKKIKTLLDKVRSLCDDIENQLNSI